MTTTDTTAATEQDDDARDEAFLGASTDQLGADEGAQLTTSDGGVDDRARVSSAGTGRGVRGKRRGGARPGRRTSSLRRSVERSFALARLDETTVRVLAAALDVEVDPRNDESLVGLTVASLEDASLARSTLRTLSELMTVDDLEAGVIATGMTTERVAFKRLWTVLGTVDPSLASGVPTRAVQAGRAVAHSARELPDTMHQAILLAHEVLA